MTNCLNNNSEIYCVILGAYPPLAGGNATSPIANLTINETPAKAKNLTAEIENNSTLYVQFEC